MIPFNFIYSRPDTLIKAQETYKELKKCGKTLYYAGGSEIITMSRAGSLRPYAVIDIKAIPELNVLYKDKNYLHIGSACSLHTIKKSDLFPLLTLACGRIADHTNQCRITLGGNLSGTIIYRETSLPFLLCDAKITILGDRGLYTVPFEKVFDGRMRLNEGELIVEILAPLWALDAPRFHVKRTASEKIDYPLVSMAALIKDSEIRIAFSGVCGFPFRNKEQEKALNDKKISIDERVSRAMEFLPDKAVADIRAGSGYRLHVLKNMLIELLENINGNS